MSPSLIGRMTPLHCAVKVDNVVAAYALLTHSSVDIDAGMYHDFFFFVFLF